MYSKLVLSLAILLVAGSAGAAAPTSADALIEKGIALRVKGQNEEALELFQKAHALAPTARTIAQIGLAEASLRRWIDAESHLVAALEAHDTPWIENQRNREVLEKTLVVIRGHIGLVTVVGPAGAEISVAGKLAGRLPLAAPLRIAEGRARVDGSAEGRRSAAVDLRVEGGQEMTVHLDLPLIALQAPAARAAVPLLAAEVEERQVAESTPWKTWTGGGLLAVSAGLIATGVVWLAVDGNASCSPPAGGRCERVYDTKPQGWIALGVGAATGAVGGVLLWQGRHTEAHVGLGLGSVSARGTF